MSTVINESVIVGVVFGATPRSAAGTVKPVWFIWRQRRYPVQDITLRWQTREGSDTILHLGVSDRANVFELALNQQTLIWRLIRVETGEAA